MNYTLESTLLKDVFVWWKKTSCTELVFLLFRYSFMPIYSSFSKLISMEKSKVDTMSVDVE